MPGAEASAEMRFCVCFSPSSSCSCDSWKGKTWQKKRYQREITKIIIGAKSNTHGQVEKWNVLDRNGLDLT